MASRSTMHRLSFFLTAVLLVTGCQDREVSPVAVDAGQGAKAAGPTVAIRPSSPSVHDDLNLVVSAGTVPPCRWRRNGELIENAEDPCLFRGNFAKGDLISATVVIDGRELTAETVIRNTPPQVAGVNFHPAEPRRGTDLTAEIRGTDADGDEIRYRCYWIVNGEELYWDEAPTLPGDRFRRGDRVALRVVPFDEEEGVAFRSEEVVAGNAPPLFVSVPPERFQGDAFVYEARAEDADGDALTYSLEEGPPGMTIDPGSGNVVWTLDRRVSGESRVKIAVQDSEGTKDFQEFILNLRVPPPTE